MDLTELRCKAIDWKWTGSWNVPDSDYLLLKNSHHDISWHDVIKMSS